MGLEVLCICLLNLEVLIEHEQISCSGLWEAVTTEISEEARESAGALIFEGEIFKG